MNESMGGPPGCVAMLCRSRMERPAPLGRGHEAGCPAVGGASHTTCELIAAHGGGYAGPRPAAPPAESTATGRTVGPSIVQLAAKPANAAANSNLALALAEREETAEAEKHVRAALKSDPNMAEAAFDLGVPPAVLHA